VRWLCLVALSACGRIDFGPRVAGAADAVASGDGSSGDGAGDAPASSVCPPTVLISDDFEDGVTAPEWTVLTATDLTVSETAGVLRVAYAANSSPNEFAGYREATLHDYTEACVIAEINAFPSPSASSASMYVRVGTGPSDNAEFSIDSGMLRSDLHNGASVKQVDVRAFDPVAHRFLRVRLTATGTSWEASPDGVTFTALGSVTTVLATAASTELQLQAQTLSASQNAGSAEWASVRVLVP